MGVIWSKISISLWPWFMYVLFPDARIDLIEKQTCLSYYHLPLKNKKLLKVWVHKIRRKNLLLNTNSRVCSIHFENAGGRCLRLDEYPTAHLPLVSQTEGQKRKSPTKRAQFMQVDHSEDCHDSSGSDDEPKTKEVEVQTIESSINLLLLQNQIAELKSKLDASQFRLSNIANNSQKVQSVLYWFFQLCHFRDILSIVRSISKLSQLLGKWNNW